MSTDFRTRRLITAADLFCGRLEKHGVREHIVKEQDFQEWIAQMDIELPEGRRGKLLRAAFFGGGLDFEEQEEWAAKLGLKPEDPAWKVLGTTERKRCLTDGTNYLWVQISNGFVASINCTISNEANNILNAIAEEFDTDIISEHDAEFWTNYEGGVIAIAPSEFKRV